ncbi:band 7 protein AGAP004871-like [Maniola hyperantus]|uniref:band 7 protein AGAP004871-like n=1 Tax=Aphantopus hyperantus TaxID=2795564 RepID=UPI003747B209
MQQKPQRSLDKKLPPAKSAETPDLEKGLAPVILQNRTSSTVVLRMQSNKEDKFIEKLAVVLSIIICIITLPFSLLCVFVVVRHFERAVILRNGHVYKNQPFGPGLIFYLPCVDSVKLLDQRTFCYAVPPQEVLTKDSLTVSVDAVVFYKIFEPILAVISVTEYKLSTHYLAATTLRNALGTRQLTEVLANRPAVSLQVFDFMKNITRDWGIEIVKVEIKDIRLPLQLQKAMAAEAESTRLANAKIIVAKAEIESTKNLQLATDILMDNPMCMQLRYLQSLQMISGDKTHTIVFPFSSDLMKNIFA